MFINVKIKGLDSNLFDGFIEGTKKDVENGLIRFAKLAQERMHNEIKSRRKRRGASNNLIGAIRINITKNNLNSSITIGEHETLNKEAPYWYVVNYGKKFTGGTFIPPATTGSFEGSAPQAGVNNQRFGQHSPGFLMKPKTFRPLHYIERTNSWLVNYWSEYWDRILT